EHALTSALRDLRRALGEGEEDTGERLIVTVRGRGYRFAGTVIEEEDAGAGLPPPPASREPFVERDAVMAELLAAQRDAAAGVTPSRLRAGRAGSGRGGVPAEVAVAPPRLGAGVPLARCYGGEGATPFWPWLQVVRGAALSEAEPAERRRLAPLAWIAPEL